MNKIEGNFDLLEDTIIYQNINYENIKINGTILIDPLRKIVHAEDKTTNKLYSIKIIPMINENSEEDVKSEILFLEKNCKRDCKPESFPFYFGHVKKIDLGEMQYLLFFNYKKSNLLQFLLSKEKNQQIYSLEDLVKLYDVLLSGLAFCQTLEYIPKDFSLESILCEVKANKKLSLNFLDFISLKSKKKSFENITKKGEILAPEIYRNQNQNINEKDYYKISVFSFALLILRVGLGHPLFNENNRIYANFVFDEKKFKNEIALLLKKLEMTYSRQIEGNNNLLPKLLNNLKNMLNFHVDTRPDFLELFRENIDFDDNEKIKTFILVNEGFTLPIFEKYENIKSKSLNIKIKEESTANGPFELISFDQMVKVSGSCGGQIKKNNFEDELSLKSALENLNPIYSLNMIIKRKENLKFWVENIILKNLNQANPLKNISIQAISNIDTKEIYEFELFYKNGYNLFIDNAISLCYENDDEESISDSEMLEILKILNNPFFKIKEIEAFRIIVNGKEELTDQTLDYFQWKIVNLNFKQLRELELGFESPNISSEMVYNILNQIAFCCKSYPENLEVLSLFFNNCGVHDIGKKNIIEPISDIIKRLQNLKKINLWLGLIKSNLNFDDLAICFNKKNFMMIESFTFSLIGSRLNTPALNDKKIEETFKQLKKNLPKILKLLGFTFIGYITDKSLSQIHEIIRERKINIFYLTFKSFSGIKENVKWIKIFEENLLYCKKINIIIE